MARVKILAQSDYQFTNHTIGRMSRVFANGPGD